jgi:hypothetical protein
VSTHGIAQAHSIDQDTRQRVAHSKESAGAHGTDWRNGKCIRGTRQCRGSWQTAHRACVNSRLTSKDNTRQRQNKHTAMRGTLQTVAGPETCLYCHPGDVAALLCRASASSTRQSLHRGV